MFQLQVAVGLLIGIQFSVNSRVANSRPFASTVQYHNLFDSENRKLDLSSFDRSLYGQPDFHSSELLHDAFDGDIEIHDAVNRIIPEEGTYVEGDLIIALDENDRIPYNITYWEKAIVPYEIHGDFLPEETKQILAVFQEFESNTCLKFIPRQGQEDFMAIESNRTSCWSGLGRRSGRNNVNLETPYCLLRNGTIIHEIMHTLGFYHENNRNDRDLKVDVFYENILPKLKRNYDKSPKEMPKSLPYDYTSIMHYPPTAFSRNGMKVLKVKGKLPEADKLMGQRNGFSAEDLKKINHFYCQDVETTTPITTTATNATITTTATIDSTTPSITNATETPNTNETTVATTSPTTNATNTTCTCAPPKITTSTTPITPATTTPTATTTSETPTTPTPTTTSETPTTPTPTTTSETPTTSTESTTEKNKGVDIHYRLNIKPLWLEFKYHSDEEVDVEKFKVIDLPE